MKSKLAYVLFGIILLFGLWTTRVKSLDRETKNLIDQARTMDGADFFPGYDLENYPIDVSYGKIEFSYEKGKIFRQKSQCPPAFTAMKTGGGPRIKVLPLKDFRNIYDLGNKSKDSLNKAYIATLFHEGFHCFQMDHGLGQGMEDLDGKNIETKKDDKDLNEVLKRLDGDKVYQRLWIQEMKGLFILRDWGNSAAYRRAREESLAYVEKKYKKRKFILYKDYINRMERIEGTARFVENSVLDAFKEERNGKFQGVYQKGQEKFYMSGALKTEIIEKKGRLKDIDFGLRGSLDDVME